MEWQAKWEEPRPRYLQRFDGLLGDVRTRRTFQAGIKGILAAGTLDLLQKCLMMKDLLSVAGGIQFVQAHHCSVKNYEALTT